MPISSSVRGPRKNDAQKRSAKPGLAAVAAVSLLLLAACTGATSDEGESAGGAALEQFMEQNLDFGPCDPSIVSAQAPVPEILEAAERAECATLTVPVDYDDLSGGTIEIAVTRNAATGKDRIGSVVLNPGGPGIQSTTFGPLVAALWAGGPIAERFDIVGFDPRTSTTARRAIHRSTPATDSCSGPSRSTPIPGSPAPRNCSWTSPGTAI